MERIMVLGFILVLLYFITTKIACNSHSHIDNNVQSELLALIDFKSGLKDPNDRLSSWKGSNYCNWQGIGCENGTGFVVSIDLSTPYPRENVYENQSSMNLNGVISPSLIKLKYLKYLDLSFYSFRAIPIPQFFGSLKNLIYLNLSHCGFIGAIPSNLGNLSNLQYLDISSGYTHYNYFEYSSDLFIENIEWMTNLVSLKHLSANYVNISMVGSQWIEVLNKLPILKEVHLDGCSLFGSIPSPSFINFTSLALIAISFNRFNSSFPEWLLNVSSLVSIDISSNKLHGRIPLSLGELPNLQHLNLSGNYYLEGCISQLLSKRWKKIEFLDLGRINGLLGSIPSSIGIFCNLKYLDLSENNLNGSLPKIINGIEACNSKSPLPNLRELHLDHNQLMGKLPNWLGGLKNLKVLDLLYNEFEGPIRALLCTLPHLESLHLALNKLNGSLPDCIGQLSELKELYIHSNQLSGTLTEQHFWKLSKLESLDVSWNSFRLNVSSNWVPPFQVRVLYMDSCDIGPEFPTWLQFQKNLWYLGLSNASISSHIPNSFGNISLNLRMLTLSYNQLHGSIPSFIGNFSNLYYLDFTSNQLSGSVSEQHFWKLSQLGELYMASNSFRLNVNSNWVPPFQLGVLSMGSCHIGPTFPAWLQSQKNLVVLDLPNASISSYIPNWFWNISFYLEYMILSHNQLQGRLPNSNLGESIPYLSFLSISGNRITGTIPDFIGHLTFLKVIDFSRNNLVGSIPSTINNCSSLIVLNLENNNLSGRIPNSLGQLQLLKSLHLNNNKLSGELPSSMQYLTGLNVLDLSYNELSGQVPAWIGIAYMNLVILNLRSNLFFGRLPSQLSNLSSIHVLDLAQNKLMGDIPVTLLKLKAMTQEKNMIIYPLYYSGGFISKYEERLVVITQGLRLEYTSTLSLVVSIDLSDNNLSGEFPQEITKLFGLVVLNLSGNHITGQIPESISRLKELLSLDLSNNKLFGTIPSSIASMSFLGYLNLSNNKLYGRIPFIGQMTTFTESAFLGNPDLCGDPLDTKCQIEDPYKRQGVDDDEDGGGYIDQWFYMSVGLGFAVGTLVPYCVLVIRKSWCEAYFDFVDDIVKWLLGRRATFAKSYPKRR